MPSMINLPAYLHLCESAEALGSGVACYRLSQTKKLAYYYYQTSDKRELLGSDHSY